jgi:hypothetical protein
MVMPASRSAQWVQSPLQALPAQTWASRCRPAARARLRVRAAPARSWALAAVTAAVMSSPMVSVSRCRLRPLTFLLDFPPWRTVYGLFARWAADSALEDVTDLLRARVRAAAGRDREPSAAIVDAQSVHECAEGTDCRPSPAGPARSSVTPPPPALQARPL